MSYEPQPTDASRVVLPEELADLAQQLAENAHEIWAQHRLIDGWTYGSERNDESKQRRDLVPYSELTAAEKQMETARVERPNFQAIRLDDDGPSPRPPTRHLWQPQARTRPSSCGNGSRVSRADPAALLGSQPLCAPHAKHRFPHCPSPPRHICPNTGDLTHVKERAFPIAKAVVCARQSSTHSRFSHWG